MGIAERKSPSHNTVFTNMSACLVLGDAIAVAGRLGYPVDPAWAEIAAKLAIPIRGKVVIPHDDYRSDEEKAAISGSSRRGYSRWDLHSAMTLSRRPSRTS